MPVVVPRAHAGRRSSRNEILEAAERVVRRDGPGGLTIEAVAREARLTKGGVLYNFPSKDALVAALGELALERFEAASAGHRAALDGQANATLRALVAAYRERRGQEPRLVSAVLAGSAARPDLLDSWRRAFRRQLAALRAEAQDPSDALVLWLALGGLMLFDTLGLLDLRDDQAEGLVETLDRRAAAA